MHSLGSCVLQLHINNKVFPTVFEVTNTPGLKILGRIQAKAMGYMQFPQIRWPHTLSTFQHASRNLCTHETPATKTTKTAFQPQVSLHKTTPIEVTKVKQALQTTEPVLPHIKWNTDSIQLNGKTHKLPITKEYILKEYNDVFKGVGTLPGSPYHIRLNKQYRPVQHPPRSVPIAMQTAYKTELDRLAKEGIIKEVKEHTEWINLIVPVMKPNGSLRLCLDPKDLNKAIKRNQWYSRTIDDILPELAKSKFKTLKDATSDYWHVVLDLDSSLLTMFNTPWGEFRWLRLPFGLKIASDAF